MLAVVRSMVPTVITHATADTIQFILFANKTYCFALLHCHKMMHQYRLPCRCLPLHIPQAHNKRATVLYLMEKYQQSIEMCELVLELNPYHFAAASGMGMCYLKLADYTGALQAFERSLRINPGLTHIQEYIKALRKQLPASETPEQ